ncbi:IclR family transcriptional regulator [Nitrospinae bacterium AH-259-F20]|nr:IclR family transcriptional regulator [Nitrospinae bacterium AH-259-F20]
MAQRRGGKSPSVIKAVDHAFDVLEALGGDREELGVTELSKELGLSKNNVFRLLATFQERDYVEQNPKTEHYRLGLKVFEMAQVYLHKSGLIRHAQPVLNEMVAACDESAYISILRDDEIVYLDLMESRHTIKLIPRVGRRLPSHCTAAGKIQLAYQSEDDLERLFKDRPIVRYTDNTVADFDALLKELARCAEQGYAVDNKEYEDEVRCVAAPVRDYTRRVVAGISIAGPVFRMTDEVVEENLVPLVVEGARTVSAKLGYSEND